MLNLPKTHWDDTELYGLLGNPVRKSLSALMHNSNFDALGMNAVYYPLAFGEDDLHAVLRALALFKYRGVNVTMPFKKAVIPFLDDMDEMGRLCRAVNTIAVRDGRLVGTNTDGIGFVRSLREQGNFDPASKPCVLFGSGGAGRGIAFALAKAGVGHITLLDIEPSKKMLDTLVSELNDYKSGVATGFLLSDETAGREIKNADLVINATCVGMTPDENSRVFDPRHLETRHFLYDIVYVPHKTELLDQAKQCGCKTLEGYWMLLWQGVEAFRFWTGLEPNVEVMQDVVIKAVTGK